MSKIKHVEDMDHNFEIMTWVLMMNVCAVNIIYPIPFDWGFSSAKKIIKFMHISLGVDPMETSHMEKIKSNLHWWFFNIPLHHKD